MALLVFWPRKPKAAERISDLARRCGDLSPIRDDVRKILVDGNRARSLAGTDAQGRRFARLAPSTLRRRKGKGPPLAPRGEASREVAGYVVDVRAGVGRLTFAGGWPEQPWMEYHQAGTKSMPKRDPYGFREQDLDRVRGLLRGYVLGDNR